MNERVNTAKNDAFDLMESGDYAGAIVLLAPLVKDEVRDAQVYSMIAKAYWETADYTEATRNYEASLRLDYSASDVHLKFAEMLMGIGKVGRALTEFELAIQYGANDALAYYNYGLALYRFGRGNDALAQWERAFELESTNPTYAGAMAIGLQGVDDEESIRYFKLAGDLGADSPSYHNNYGLQLRRMGRHGESVRQFARAVELRPGNDKYRFNLAAAYTGAGDHAAATPLWEMMLEASPDNAAYHIYLGRAYYEGQRFADAIRLLQPWLDGPGVGPTSGGDPGIDEAYETLAMSLRGAGEVQKAIPYIAKAVELEPASVTHLNNYGVILAENGMLSKAKVQWTKALELDPDNAAARQNLSAYDR